MMMYYSLDAEYEAFRDFIESMVSGENTDPRREANSPAIGDREMDTELFPGGIMISVCLNYRLFTHSYHLQI